MTTNKLRFVEENGGSVFERKARLRAYMKSRRGDNENRDVKEELLIENFFKALEEKGLQNAENFFVYLSFSSEAPTDKLIEELLERGKTVYCPRTLDGEMFAVLYGEDFTVSSLGIREPVGEIYQGVIDVAVIPLLAVDRLGNRLGYGKGYYDRYLKDKPCKRVGYCFDFQIVEKIPMAETDERMDILVTDKQTVYI